LIKEKKIHFNYFLVDMDWLKELNDLYWYTYGDKAIKEMWIFLKKVINPDYQSVFRIWGDEFVVISLPMVKKYFTSVKWGVWNSISLEKILRGDIKNFLGRISKNNINIEVRKDWETENKKVNVSAWGWCSLDYNNIWDLFNDVSLRLKENKAKNKWYDIRKLPELVKMLEKENERLKKENKKLKKK